MAADAPRLDGGVKQIDQAGGMPAGFNIEAVCRLNDKEHSHA